MNISPDDKKLEKYLDELADEYKKLLFSALISRSQSLDNLSVSELLRLDNKIKKTLLQDYDRQQRRRRRLFSFGVVYLLSGLLCYILSKVMLHPFVNTTEIISLISIVITLIGLCVSLYSFVDPVLNISLGKNINGQKNYAALLKYETVAKWRELEGLVSDINLSMNNPPPRSIIDFLIENKFIDKNEHSTLKEFLKMRNNVVHSTDNEYSESEIRKMIDKVNKIIEKIKKIA